MIRLFNKLQDLLDASRRIDFLGPLALRLYLAPIFILAGSNKLANAENVGHWFASLGIPAPELMAWLAGLTELIGGVLLIAGLGVRWIAVPLMVTMVVAAAAAHWEQGWHVLPEQELTVPWEWRTDLIQAAAERKQQASAILREHGNYGWLTEAGSITVLKNGIEFAATYFIMLLVLFFAGGGRYVSVDYWLAGRSTA
jgi:uncharacterized membrane protein YphA (DoxX/SURF4 family)